MKSDLSRFVDAQAGVYADAIYELRRGRKNGHWIWFIFPQFRGLGSSSTSAYFAIQSLEEARKYAEHPSLGSRLIECTAAVVSHTGMSAERIFGYPDVLKFCSSMTLFERASPGENIFPQALEKYYEGQRDSRTIVLLEQEAGA